MTDYKLSMFCLYVIKLYNKKNGKANDRKLHMWNMRANNIGFIQWTSFKFPLKI